MNNITQTHFLNFLNFFTDGDDDILDFIFTFVKVFFVIFDRVRLYIDILEWFNLLN